MGKAEIAQVVFIFENAEAVTTFRFPNVDHCVADLTGVTAGRCCTKRVIMFHVEVVSNGDDQKRLVVWQDWTGTMKGFDVKCACLSSFRGRCNLTDVKYGDLLRCEMQKRSRNRCSKGNWTSTRAGTLCEMSQKTKALKADVSSTWSLIKMQMSIDSMSPVDEDEPSTESLR